MKMLEENRLYTVWYRSTIALLIVDLILLVNYFLDQQTFGGISYQLNSGPSLFFNPDKKKDLVKYAADVSILFSVWMFILMVKSRWASVGGKIGAYYYRCYESWGSRYLPVLLLVLPLVIGVAIKSNEHRVYAQLLLLLYAFIFLYAPWAEGRFAGMNVGLKVVLKIFPYTVLVVIFVQVVWIFSDVLFKKPKIISEYYNYPEMTILDSLRVYNTSYFNTHINSVLTKKRDIREPGDFNNYVDVFGDDVEELIRDKDECSLFYDKKDGRLYLNGVMDSLIVNRIGIKGLYDLNETNRLSDREFARKKYDDQELQFLRLNEYEYRWQIFERFIIHHHNFMLSPLNELSHGRPSADVVAQYGIGSALIINGLLHFLDGDVTMQGWYFVWAVFYIAYYLLLGFVMLSIFREKWVALFVVMICVGLLNFRGYDFILLAPGESPWRHFFDLMIIYGLYVYQRNRSKMLVVFLLMLGLLSLYINPQIGLMIYFSLFTVLLFSVIYERSEWRIISLFLFVYVAVGCYVFKAYPSINPLAKYYIDGLLGFAVPDSHLRLFVLAVAAMYIMAFRVVRKDTPYLMILFVFVYAQSLLVYALWHYNYDGLLPRSHVYVMAVMLLVYYNRDIFAVEKYRRLLSTAKVFVLIMGTLFYVGSYAEVYKGRVSYDRIFETHYVYEWPFRNYRVESTMNPEYLVRDVGLVKKYSGVASPGIYIISQYDNLLPFLSGKYSKMPFFDLKWYGVTNKEVDAVVNCILKDKPEYLFVDNDIDRNHNCDIIDPKIPVIGWLNEESVWRVQRHNIMRRMYERVKDQYVVVEEGSLLSAYKKVK